MKTRVPFGFIHKSIVHMMRLGAHIESLESEHIYDKYDRRISFLCTILMLIEMKIDIVDGFKAISRPMTPKAVARENGRSQIMRIHRTSAHIQRFTTLVGICIKIQLHFGNFPENNNNNC